MIGREKGDIQPGWEVSGTTLLGLIGIGIG